MRWDDVLTAVTGAVVDDPTLSGIYGEAIRQRGAVLHAIPSLEIWLVTDAETELWEPVVLQFDQRTETQADLISSERRLRSLFSRDFPVTLDGIVLYCEYIDGADLTAPTDENTNARAVRFSFQALREALQRP